MLVPFQFVKGSSSDIREHGLLLYLHSVCNIPFGMKRVCRSDLSDFRWSLSKQFANFKGTHKRIHKKMIFHQKTHA